MRILLAAGLNDLIKGGNKESVTNSILRLKNAIDDQNIHHPDNPNELVVATLPNPPKLTWFDDNGLVTQEEPFNTGLESPVYTELLSRQHLWTDRQTYSIIE